MTRVPITNFGLETLIDRRPRLSKGTLLLITAILLTATALADWRVGRVSLGVLYILPMMTGALILEPFELAALALLCAFLRSRFDYPGTQIELVLRFVFASVSYFTCGLFVAALVLNRRRATADLAKIQREQELRRVAEDQLRLLVSGSPAAIITLDGEGTVLAANRAANSMFGIPEDDALQGHAIEKYLSVLSDALRLRNVDENFRTEAQCTGYRSNGEVFNAHTWFSSYFTPEGMRLAAIIVDSSEQMRDREEQNFRHLLRAIRIATTAVSHESRNLSAAISLLCSHVSEKHQLDGDEDLEAIVNLAQGIEKMAALSLDVQRGDSNPLDKVPLRQVLDHLRIVIEPEWSEIEGRVNWNIPQVLPSVIADAHGLLQAFLNLAKNSHRSVHDKPKRELTITVSVEQERVFIRFQDSGFGISAPDRLFQPFQEGADGTGIGLYLSRAVVRSYGGELRYEPTVAMSSFAIELEIA